MERRKFLGMLFKGMTAAGVIPNAIGKAAIKVLSDKETTSLARYDEVRKYIDSMQSAVDSWITNYAENISEGEDMDFEWAKENGWDYLTSLDMKSIIKELEPFIEENLKELEEEPNSAYSVNYSRMDYAGGSEDVGYSKYDESVKRILEAMDRRQFLKMLGKGASVAGVAPGAVGKMAMNLATGSAPIDINKTIIDYVNFTYNGGMYKGFDKTFDIIRKYLLLMYSFIKQNKLPIEDIRTVNNVKTALKQLDPEYIKKFTKENNLPEDEYLINYVESGIDVDGFDGMLKVLFQHNLVNKEAQEVIAHHTGMHWYDYVDTPEAKKIRDETRAEIEADNRRKFHQYLQQHTAKDINYSRMDTAGGSEDVGYAKYFESYIKENYADGKKPGRKGLAKRSGVNCKQSVTKLRKIAKNSTGERRRMAHWCANMKAGKKKKIKENYMGDTNPMNIPSVDTWHAGQELAIQGKTKEAVATMTKAAKQAKIDDSMASAKYYMGTVAWLNKDFNTVQQYINDPELKQTGNDKVLARLLQNKNSDYNTAYNA